jgi:hypothetical protein
MRAAIFARDGLNSMWFLNTPLMYVVIPLHPDSDGTMSVSPKKRKTDDLSMFRAHMVYSMFMTNIQIIQKTVIRHHVYFEILTEYLQKMGRIQPSIFSLISDEMYRNHMLYTFIQQYINTLHNHQSVKKKTTCVTINECIIAELKQFGATPRNTMYAWSDTNPFDVAASPFTGVLEPMPNAQLDTELSELPISTYEHDCTQLECNRISRTTGKAPPVCCYRACKLKTTPCFSQEVAEQSTNESLYVYLLDTEEDHFQQTGIAREGACLLCIRRDAEAASIRLAGDISHEVTHVEPRLILPFTNIANRPGGYKTDCLVGSVHVVGRIPRISSSVFLTINKETGQYYVDQSNIMWSPSPVQPVNC